MYTVVNTLEKFMECIMGTSSSLFPKEIVQKMMDKLFKDNFSEKCMVAPKEESKKNANKYSGRYFLIVF